MKEQTKFKLPDSGSYGIVPSVRINKKLLLSLVILVPMCLTLLVSPLIVPYDPVEQNIQEKYASPNQDHPFGTDHLGRDLLSRVMVGGRSTLFLGLAATGLSILLGTPLGLISGYKGERVDEVLMRVMDLMMSFPALLLALLILTALSSNIWNAILAVGFVFTPKIARVIRSSTLSVKNEQFVEAAKARGESDTYIIFREIFPNVISPILVEGSIRVGYAIIVGASLSFLGLGVQPPTADWGYMIAEARNHIWLTPWFLIWPALMLGLTILGFNLLGDGLRDRLDPRETGERI